MAALERLDRVRACREDVEDAVHPGDLEDGAHGLRQAAQFEIAICGAQPAQAGEDRSQSGAIHELKWTHVEHHFGVRVQNWVSYPV
jgi:hypothetical protein